MELKDLAGHINSHLKKYSLAHAEFEEEIFDDKVTILHPDPRHYSIGSKITITYSLGWWYLDYQEGVDYPVSIKLQINSNDNSGDIHELMQFVNSHTMHEYPEAAKVNVKNDNFIKDFTKK